MAEVKPKTIGQSLHWSYANLVMAWVSFIRGDTAYEKFHFIIRNRTYSRLLRGTTKIGSFLKDEKRKLFLSHLCSYCGSQDDLTLDHMIPRIKSGPHSADNLVVACRSCNSSKHARELLEWMAAKQEFPTLTVLSRYLKIAVAHCEENSLMEVPLKQVLKADHSDGPGLFDYQNVELPQADAISLDPVLPFSIDLIPHRFPEPEDLVAWWIPIEEEE